MYIYICICILYWWCFSIFFYVVERKSCGNEKMAYRYRFKALAISSYGSPHSHFRILVTVLLTCSVSSG